MLRGANEQLEPGSANAGQLFGAHAQWLRRVLRSWLGTVEIDDVVQETFHRLLKYPLAKPVRAPRALLLKIAVNVAAADYKRAARRRSVETESQSIAVPLSDEAESAALKQLVLSLPETYRDTFLMSRFLGLTHHEIAQRQGISVKTVEWRVSKAMALCRRRLEG